MNRLNFTLLRNSKEYVAYTDGLKKHGWTINDSPAQYPCFVCENYCPFGAYDDDTLVLEFLYLDQLTEMYKEICDTLLDYGVY